LTQYCWRLIPSTEFSVHSVQALMCSQPAEGDKQAVRKDLAAMFARVSDQNMRMHSCAVRVLHRFTSSLTKFTSMFLTFNSSANTSPLFTLQKGTSTRCRSTLLKCLPGSAIRTCACTLVLSECSIPSKAAPRSSPQCFLLSTHPPTRHRYSPCRRGQAHDAGGTCCNVCQGQRSGHGFALVCCQSAPSLQKQPHEVHLNVFYFEFIG